MAVIPYVLVPNSDRASMVVKWEAVTEADTCAAVALPAWSDRSVQVNGTFGGATVIIQGSNDGTNYVTLNNPADAALSFAAAGLEAVLELTATLKPSISGGTGQSINIYLHMRGDR